MIDYEEEWLYKLLFRSEGSVGIRASYFALPSALLAVVLHFLDTKYPSIRHDSGLEDMSESQLWAALTAVTMLLLSFRARQALSRFWEGTGLLHMMRGEWYDSVSCLITFSRQAKAMKEKDVERFRHTLVRIMSLCHGSALQEIKDQEEMDDIATIDVGGLDSRTLKHLKECKEVYDFNRVEVLLHLTQTLVTTAHDEGVLKIPPPILSRVYQTLSRGFVNLLNAKKITDTRFPFPFAQLITILLFILCLLTPMYLTNVVQNYFFAPLVTFVVIFGMFSVNFAASELENPFGSDDNDLPLAHFQNEMNSSLLMLLHNDTDHIPTIGPRCVMEFDRLCEGVATSRISTLCAQDLTSMKAQVEEDESNEMLLKQAQDKHAAQQAAAEAAARAPPAPAPAPAPEAAPAPSVAVAVAAAPPKDQMETKLAEAGSPSLPVVKGIDSSLIAGDIQPLLLASMAQLNVTMGKWMQQVEDQALELNRNTGVLQHFTDALPAFLDSASVAGATPTSTTGARQGFYAAVQAREVAVNRGPYMFAMPPAKTQKCDDVSPEDECPIEPKMQEVGSSIGAGERASAAAPGKPGGTTPKAPASKGQEPPRTASGHVRGRPVLPSVTPEATETTAKPNAGGPKPSSSEVPPVALETDAGSRAAQI